MNRDGKIAGSRGNPNVMGSLGKCCGKSLSRVADLYDPNRITKPMMRTNPNKGLGVDPMWKEIEWEEALAITAKKLVEVHADDPRGLVIAVFDTASMAMTQSFGKAFGTPNFAFLNATYCGGGEHSHFLHVFGTVNTEIDLEHCEHIVLWGAQSGLGAHNNPTRAARLMAEARSRGAKLVVIDPIMGSAASKADQWIPIIPGTDGALALAIVNLLLNEYGIYDKEFLQRRTNGTYLIGQDGHYLRDPATKKPLVWNNAKSCAEVFDAVPTSDAALEGSFRVGDTDYKTAFTLLKRHLLGWTAERAAKITGVPIKTIRDFALEHGQAARIGAVIEVDGKVLPLRPAAIELKRGVNAHKNSYFNCTAVTLINVVLGAMDIPGGVMGLNTQGPYGAYKVFAGLDGILETTVGGLAECIGFHTNYPPNEVTIPDSVNMKGLFPVSGYLSALPHYAMSDPAKIKLPYRPKALLAIRTNFIKSYHDPRAIADYLSKLEFIAAFARQVDEVAEFADIVFPEAHDYERYSLFPTNFPAAFQTPGPGDWYMQMNQPVVDAPKGVRNWIDVMIELADRVGILPLLNEKLNVHAGGLMAGWELEHNKKYTAEDICKRQVNGYGAAAGVKDPLGELNSVGKLTLYKKTLDESYPGYAMTGRIPLYPEHFIDVGTKVKALCDREGFDWIDPSWYNPLPEWRPCPAHEEVSDKYDLFLANGKAAILHHSNNASNAWVDDVLSTKRYTRYVLLHTTEARKRGLQDEDDVYVESKTGRVRGKLRVTECVHPKVLGTFGNGGGWARNRPIAQGKGVHSNSLIAFDWNMFDSISGQIDTCARVRIYKAED